MRFENRSKMEQKIQKKKFLLFFLKKNSIRFIVNVLFF